MMCSTHDLGQKLRRMNSPRLMAQRISEFVIVWILSIRKFCLLSQRMYIVSTWTKESLAVGNKNTQPPKPAAERILEAAKSEIDERGVLGFRVLEVSE